MSKLTTGFCGSVLLAGFCCSALAVPLTSASISIDTFLTGDPAASQNTATVATLGLVKNGSNVDFVLNNTLNNLAAGGNGFLSQLMFSYDNNPIITNANIGAFGGTQAVASYNVAPVGTASYDFFIDFEFPTANNAPGNRFVNGENVTWTITGVAIEDFLTPDPNNTNGALALVHLQGLGTGSYSVKYTGDLDGPTGPGGGELPEPGTLVLVALGLVAAGWRFRKPG